MNFSEMKVSSRLALAFGVVLLLVVLTSLFALNRLAAIESNLEDVVLDNNVKIKLNAEMAESVHVVSRVMRSVILLTDKVEQEKELEKLKKSRDAYETAWTALQKMPASEEGQAMRAKIQSVHNETITLNDHPEQQSDRDGNRGAKEPGHRVVVQRSQSGRHQVSGCDR